MRKYSVSIIGCGRIFNKHISAINKNKKFFEIEAICEIDKNKFIKKKLHNIKYFKNIEDLKKNTNSDLYVILTPSGDHYDHIKKIANKGRTILVEKPLVLDLRHAKKLKNLEKKHKTKIFVVKQNRHNPAIKKLHDAIKEKRFGKIFLITIRVRWKRDKSYFQLDKWRGYWKKDGGVLANQASHHVDLLQWMGGNVDSVYSKKLIINKFTKAADTVTAIIKFKSGALGVIEATTASQPKDIESSISILGNKGTVVIGGFAVSKIINWDFIKKKKSDKNINKFSSEYKNVYGFGHIEIYKEINKYLSKKSNNCVTFSEGLNSIKLIDKIYASAELDKEIKMNDKNYSKLLGK